MVMLVMEAAVVMVIVVLSGARDDECDGSVVVWMGSDVVTRRWSVVLSDESGYLLPHSHTARAAEHAQSPLPHA